MNEDLDCTYDMMMIWPCSVQEIEGSRVIVSDSDDYDEGTEGIFIIEDEVDDHDDHDNHNDVNTNECTESLPYDVAFLEL